MAYICRVYTMRIDTPYIRLIYAVYIRCVHTLCIYDVYIRRIYAVYTPYTFAVSIILSLEIRETSGP